MRLAKKWKVVYINNNFELGGEQVQHKGKRQKKAFKQDGHVMEQAMTFIHDQLDDDALECFMKHVDQCPDCYEETQISYFLYNGLKMLDDEQPASFQLQKEFDRMMQEKREYIRKKRKIKNAIAFFLGIVFAGVLLFGAYTLFKFFVQIL